MNSPTSPWSLVPHGHEGPARQTGADDHIYSPRQHNGRFKAGGIVTFMGAPYCPPDRNAIRAMGAKICFLGVPWDQGQVVRAGTSAGPGGLREASTQYFPYLFEYDVDVLTFFKLVDCGDVPIVPGNNDRTHRYIYDYVSECLHAGAKVILCGGDHSVPIPAARALSDFHRDGRIGYLHIDCHLDSAPDWGGIVNTNCSGPSRALELPNCDRSNIAHMGSRNGLNPKDWWDFFRDNDVRVIPMLEVVQRGVEACAREIFDIASRGTQGIYCSWDTDSLDASCMPGTTAPECFGIKPREAIQIARIAGRYGADILEISELCPTFDVSQISIKLACCLVHHYLGSRAQALIAEGRTP
jgi:agmatinase